MQLLNIANEKYGMLTVLAEVEKPKHLATQARYWLCRCDCGNEKVFLMGALRTGNTKSCGCNKGNFCSQKALGHGHSTIRNGKSLTYESWTAMRSRCNNPKQASYKNYGGRGIKICDEWNNSFEAFLKDMGERPSSQYSLERIDNNGNYCPGNCKWASLVEQANNKSTNRIISFGGKTMTFAQWSRFLGIDERTLRARINRYGWSIEKAFTTPIRRSNSKPLPQLSLLEVA